MAQGLDAKRKSALSLERARRIATLFELPSPVEVFDFQEKGNINQETYLVTAGAPGHSNEYLLQQLNYEVFTQPRAVMDSMIACIQAQEKALQAGALRIGEEWEPITLVPARGGKLYLEITEYEGLKCWRMMARISNARTYKSLIEIPDSNKRLRVAEEAGKGLALFGTLTAGMDPDACRPPLFGYRDPAFYYAQLKSILAGNRTAAQAVSFLPQDPVGRQSTEQYFVVHLSSEEYSRRKEDPHLRGAIDLALKHELYALTLSEKLKTGVLKKVVVHGDTKLDNFLFNTLTGKVKAMVDLDTVMPHTWLSDWGDMARSLTNIAGEREPDFTRVRVDVEIFKALARGYIGTARGIAAHESDLMVDAARIMALELGVRFLTDHLRGDNYFKLRYPERPDLNKIRALVQFAVFESLSRKASLLRRCIEDLYRTGS